MMPSTITERDFQNAIVELATYCGWRVYHTWNSKHSPAGFPDLVLVRPGRHVLFWEVKTERGKVSTAQQAWIDDLRNTGQIAVVLRPSNWGWIEQVLTGRFYADQLTGGIV
jgi:hypothetical protein